MSDSISAWVDEGEMRRLAESLLCRPCGHELNQLEVSFGSQFEGFADSVVESVSAPAVWDEPVAGAVAQPEPCLLYTSPSPRDRG